MARRSHIGFSWSQAQLARRWSRPLLWGIDAGPLPDPAWQGAWAQYVFTALEIGQPGSPGCYVVTVDEADMGDCNIPITPTECDVRLDTDNPSDLDNGFGFKRQPEPPPVVPEAPRSSCWRAGPRGLPATPVCTFGRGDAGPDAD